MAAVRGGRGGVEEELVGAAVQISELRQEAKRLRRARDSALNEKAALEQKCREGLRVIKELEAGREQVAKQMEDMKKNEKEAVETAQKAFAELKSRAAETEELKAELRELRAAMAAPAAETPSNRRRVTATGIKPVSLGGGPGAGGASAGCATQTGGGARYAMDAGSDANGSAAATQTGNGGKLVDNVDEKEQGDVDKDESDEEEEEEEDEDDQEGNGRGRGGFGLFGWLTGSARKRRRYE